ncbi:hypothetical protein ACFX43_10700 [Nocardioides sp. YIM B13467]
MTNPAASACRTRKLRCRIDAGIIKRCLSALSRSDDWMQRTELIWHRYRRTRLFYRGTVRVHTVHELNNELVTEERL